MNQVAQIFLLSLSLMNFSEREELAHQQKSKPVTGKKKAKKITKHKKANKQNLIKCSHLYEFPNSSFASH